MTWGLCSRRQDDAELLLTSSSHSIADTFRPDERANREVMEGEELASASSMKAPPLPPEKTSTQRNANIRSRLQTLTPPPPMRPSPRQTTCDGDRDDLEEEDGADTQASAACRHALVHAGGK